MSSQGSSIELTSGLVRNSLPGELSHLFYRNGSNVLRSVCGGVETAVEYLYQTDYVLCEVCTGERENGSLDPENEVKMSGHEPDLTTEEYMLIFNRMVNEGEELAYRLPAVKDMTPEELVDHVNMLSKFSARIRIAKQAAKVTLEAKRIHLGTAQREALKLRDMQYKPKRVVDESKPGKPRRASGTAKTEDAIETIMKLMGCTREQAEKRLAKAKATVEASDEKS